MKQAVAAITQERQFAPSHQVVEIVGLCEHCRNSVRERELRMNERVAPACLPDVAGPQPRRADGRRSRSATSLVGGGAPIVVQSMTNTDTADIAGTVAQVAALARQGSELVRITVDRDEAAAAVPHIRERLDRDRRRRAAGRRFPLYRPQAAGRASRPAPRRWRSTGSIPAMSASRTRRTASSARSSSWRSSTARRCASAPTGARSTRSC